MATTLLLEGYASHWLPGGASCIERLTCDSDTRWLRTGRRACQSITCLTGTTCFPALPHLLWWPAPWPILMLHPAKSSFGGSGDSIAAAGTLAGQACI